MKTKSVHIYSTKRSKLKLEKVLEVSGKLSAVDVEKLSDLKLKPADMMIMDYVGRTEYFTKVSDELWALTDTYYKVNKAGLFEVDPEQDDLDLPEGF